MTSIIPHSSELVKALETYHPDDVPAPIADVVDPYNAPSHFLPFLAANHSVDLWFNDWPEDLKREVIAQYAGRSTLFPGEKLASLYGTRLAAQRLLSHVGASIVDAISHPHRPFVRHFAVGRMLVGHPAFRAIYLVGVTVPPPSQGFAVGRYAVSRRAVRRPDFTPIKRAREAVKVAKALFTEVLLDFSTARVLTAGDAVSAGSAMNAGHYLPRTKLGPN